MSKNVIGQGSEGSPNVSRRGGTLTVGECKAILLVLKRRTLGSDKQPIDSEHLEKTGQRSAEGQ